LRARLALFAVLAVALIVTLLSAGGGHHPRRERPAPAAERPTVVGATPAPAPPPRAKPRAKAARSPRDEVDPQDHDPRLRARLRRAQVTGAAFQHLPWAGDGIAIDFGEAGADGRVRLEVTYLATRDDARRAYRRFLARFDDDGRGYRVTYRPSAGG
jgi:hypothetical protein